MVLQRSQPVPIWGTAKPSYTITVTLVPQGNAPINPPATVATKADANGKWRVELAPLKASSQPMEVPVNSAAGDPAVVMTDVLVGEVWVPVSTLSFGSTDTLTRAGEVRGELLLVFGRQDSHVPREGRRLIYETLDRAGTSFTWHEFNAAHAFLRDEGERYDPSAARLGLSLAADLFGRCL